jgi:hypothetical protein
VDYSVTESIFIADFSPSKHEYKTTEAISTTVMVENAGSEDVANLSAVLTVKDLQDHTLNSTQQNLATVPAGGSIETPVTISNGLSTGSYLIILEIKDATNSTLAVSSEYIKVTSEYIAGLAVPEESNSTDDIPFTVTVQNDNPAPITADVAIKIYNEQGEHVVGLSAPSEEVPAGTSAAITTYWSDPGKDGGLYTATALVSAGGKQYVYHFSFTVLCAAGRDADADGICDSEDNCSAKPNGLKLGTCITLGKTVSYCTTPGPNVSECGTNGFCSMDQEDSYPPQGNNCGDTCECEGNFDGDLDVDVDGSDAAAFKASFGRSTFQRPCTNADSCNGDFSCDVDVDGTDAALFKSDFGRSTFNNPCPNCITNPWCVYP